MEAATTTVIGDVLALPVVKTPPLIQTAAVRVVSVHGSFQYLCTARFGAPARQKQSESPSELGTGRIITKCRCQPLAGPVLISAIYLYHAVLSSCDMPQTACPATTSLLLSLCHLGQDKDIMVVAPSSPFYSFLLPPVARRTFSS
jgi:hypothetical protein